MIPVHVPPPSIELALPQPPAWNRTPREERVDPGEETSDFNAGDIELKIRLGFGGNSYFPQTLVTSFFNWFELQGCVDVGVWERDYLTLGLGAELWLGRPWIPEAVSPLTSSAEQELDWRATTRGIALRGTAHYTLLSSFDPYAVVLVGPTVDTVYAARTDRAAVGRTTSGGLRMGAGGGVNVVSNDRVMGGLELRYLVSTRFRSGVDIPIETEDGVSIDQFTITRSQRPPRGFSWVAFVGVRL
ncbi:MAG: hypothetical protein AB8H79_11420 [Myxococcota bacterium]